MTDVTMSSLGIKEESIEFEKETQTLGEFVGQKLRITGIEAKKLGSYDGVIFTLMDSVKDKQGDEWNKIHTTKSSIVSSFKDVQLKDGDVLTVKVVGGKGSKGKDWYDIKDI